MRSGGMRFNEAFGRVLIEAMLAKCPIVATHVNGIPEVVGECALLIAPREAAALTHAMQTLITMDEHTRRMFIDKAHQRVCTQFAIPAFNQQFWNVIQ